MKKIILIHIFLGIILAATSLVVAQQLYQQFAPNPLSYYSGRISDYWPSYGKEECTARQDFIVQILPGGCSPAVVRSDLLEEQNVPVFCQLTGIKINPLIDVPEITSITFKGKDIPKDIGGIGFHPARAALKTWGSELLGSPIVNNLGYLVVMLKRQPIEKNMSKWVEAELTAVIQYKAEKAFGVGRTSFVSSQIDKDEDWHQYYKQYSFWKGKGYVRVREIGTDEKGQFARVDIYLDENRQMTSLTLREGQTSQDIYMPGYYCQAALKMTLQDITSEPKPKVKLDINGEEIWVSEGQKIIDDKCSVSKIEQDIYGSGEAEIRCPDGLHKLSLNPAKARLVFESEGTEIDRIFSVKDELTANKGVFVAFIGDTGKAKNEKIKNLDKQFIVIAKPANRGITVLNDQYYEAITFKIRKLIEGDKFKGFGTLSEQNFLSVIKLLTGAEKLKDLGDISDDLSKTENEKQFKEELEKRLKTQFGNKLEFQVFLQGDETLSVKFSDAELKDFRFEGLESSYDKEYKSDIGKVMEEYYNNAIEEYRKIQVNYGSEKSSQIEEEDSYGAQALDKAADLASYLKKFKTQGELLTELIEKYPNSKLAEGAKTKLRGLKGNDMSNAVTTAFIEGDAYNIVLEEVRDVSLSDKSVKLIVKNEEGTYTVGDVITGTDTVTIKDIKEDYIELENVGLSLTKPKIKKGETATVTYKKTEGDKTTTASVTVKVSEINLHKEARILLTPLVERTETQTNFTFKIGIEKRAIQLSPEKTKSIINDLNNSIAQWEKLTTDLGSLVKTWKATCFAGSAFLWAKSFFDNLGGGSIARQKVMRGTDGWWEKCGKLVEEKQYDDVQKCLAANNNKIEDEIAVVKDQIDPVNQRIKNTAVAGKTEDSRQKRMQSIQEDKTFASIGDDLTKNGNLGNNTENPLKASDVGSIMKDLNKSDAFSQDLSDMELWMRVYKDPRSTPELKEKAKDNLYKIMSPMQKTIALNNEKETLKKSLPEDYVKNVGSQMLELTNNHKTQAPIFKETKKIVVEGKEGSEEYKGEASIIPSSMGLLYIMGDRSGNSLMGNKIYHLEKSPDNSTVKLRELSKEEEKLVAGGIVVKETTLKCNNLYRNPEVKYHETEPSKGLPALVPLDTNEGWYAATRPAGMGISAFASSGKVESFWLCNVGPNGLAEFFSSADNDDICQQYNLYQTNELSSFNCIDNTKLNALVTKAQQSIYKVASAYKSGIKSISLPGIEKAIPVTAAPVLNPGIECEDFMSPGDCNTMFNLCDPVLCPPSRCDFGGRYAVPDVVQTGIIGGIMLCLPNFGMPSEGGVIVPVCLSGIHAGLDNLVMIMKAYRGCLQENLDTGRTVGICDEMQSIYLCEFFWKQAIPLMKIGVPQLMQSIFEGKGKGGGEYLVVQDSWDNLGKSVNYFTNYYGANAFKAFQSRSTEEIGSEVCKGFVSARYPTSKDFFDKLTEPESPTQFYAKFSENVLTDATVPATSQYKVYVWIYAGKDKGVYYNVYLKGSSAPATAYYQSLGNIQVPSAVGFIPKGEKIDKAVDFTAPAGYKELCVRIDNNEKCGFTQVTTDFAVDELQNLYLEEQATKEITKEEECVSGSASLIPLASLNIQQGVEEATNPAIYKRGIIRICATNDPGASTEPGRYTAVGYCTDKNVKCWLDTKSVNQSISDTGIATRTLENAKSLVETLDVQGLWDNKTSYEEIIKSTADAGKILEEIEKDIQSKTTAREIELFIEGKINPVINELRDVMSKSLVNSYKIKAEHVIVGMYDKITRIIYEKKMGGEVIGKEEILPDGSKAEDILKPEKTKLNESIKILEIHGNNAVAEGQTTHKKYYLEDDGSWTELEEGKTIFSNLALDYADIDLDGEKSGEASLSKEETVYVMLDGNKYPLKLVSMNVKDIFLGSTSVISIDSEGKTAWGYQYQRIEFEQTGTGKAKGIMDDSYNYEAGASKKKVDLNGDKKYDILIEIMEMSFKNQDIKIKVTRLESSSLLQKAKEVLQNLNPFRVEEAEAAEIIPDDWADGSYNSQDFVNAQKEDSYQQRKAVYLLVNQYAKQYDKNFNVIRAIIEKESSFKPNEVAVRKEKPGTAIGYMGLTTDATNDIATGTCKNFCGFSVNRNNIEQNIRGGICYYACQYDEFKDVNLALAAYNQGPTYVRKNCKSDINSCKNPFGTTKGDNARYYAKRIIDIYDEIITRQEIIQEGGSKNKVIVIDPGHGGKDPGASNPYDENKPEKVIALEIAKKLKTILEARGYSIIMTRENDSYLSLSKRVEISNEAKADLFVSIHTNSAGIKGEPCASTATGTQIAYYRNTRTFTPQLAKAVAESISTATGLKLREYEDKTSNIYVVGGVYGAGYQVLGETNEAPGIYIETAFICNQNDESILKNPSEQQQIAAAISQSVSMYA